MLLNTQKEAAANRDVHENWHYWGRAEAELWGRGVRGGWAKGTSVFVLLYQ